MNEISKGVWSKSKSNKDNELCCSEDSYSQDPCKNTLIFLLGYILCKQKIKFKLQVDNAGNYYYQVTQKLLADDLGNLESILNSAINDELPNIRYEVDDDYLNVSLENFSQKIKGSLITSKDLIPKFVLNTSILYDNTYSVQIKLTDLNRHQDLLYPLNICRFYDSAPGMPFWLHNGVILRDNIIKIIDQSNNKYNFTKVITPIISDIKLWQNSGHIAKYSDNIFFTESNHKTYALKPMNCPMHMQIFKASMASYKQLPVRICELGIVHRNESSGSVNGLLRTRCFTQDDAHIFLNEELLISEIKTIVNQALDLYKQFGFNQIKINIAKRPLDLEGDDQEWLLAENSLIDACNQLDLRYTTNNDGAFYGPKIEFHLQDNSGRWWQCGTIQVDLIMSKKLDCNYVNHQGNKVNCIIIHRAILGSIERFIAILLEHYRGFLPLIINPVQLAIYSLKTNNIQKVIELKDLLQSQGVRVVVDTSNRPLSAKIKEGWQKKFPLIGVIGSKEEILETISLKTYTHQEYNLKINEIINFIDNHQYHI